MRDRHERTVGHLPALGADELPWWRRRLVERHLRRCAACAAEAEREREVEAELARLGAAGEPDGAPPPELLDQLLAQARDPGLRQRVAVPARGAVSGARPGLSVALVLVVLALVGLAAWSGWRLGRWWVSRDR